MYWVYDPHDKRYEAFLFTSDKETAKIKIINEEICHDLVYARLHHTGLDDGDNAAINVIYKDKNTNEEIVYRKVLFIGKGMAIVGIPPRAWKFKVTPWSNQYKDPKIEPLNRKTDPVDYYYTSKRSQNMESDIIFNKKYEMTNLVTYEKKSK